MKDCKAVKKRVYELINKAEDGDRTSQIFDWTIMILIALSVISIVLESFTRIYNKYHPVFQVLEVITVVVFTAEYLLRIWTADLLYPDAKHPHLKYIFSFMALIDLLAILPFYLPFISADLRFLRMMRLLRLFRLLRVIKLERYFNALQIIVRVIKASGPQLIMTVVLCLFVMLFSAIIMYTVENPVQPEQFPNVIASLWWAICTLTTVGYGDVYPITHIGRFFASVISVVGIGILAIPTGIIAAGFNRSVSQEKEEEAIRESQEKDAIENMNHEELLLLQARIVKKLSDDGFFQKTDMKGKEENDQVAP